MSRYVSFAGLRKTDSSEFHLVKLVLSSLKVSIVPIPDRSHFETILIENEDSEPSTSKRPLVTVVHGGPHGSNAASFNAALLSLTLQGCTSYSTRSSWFLKFSNHFLSTDTVSLPNFTGSLGYGDDFVQQLVGKCGTLDVDDVMASIKHLLKMGIAEEGPGKQFVQGGSHGGFITAHCTYTTLHPVSSQRYLLFSPLIQSLVPFLFL